MKHTMSLRDVSDLLNVKPYRIEYLFANKLLPEPDLRVGGRRVFTPEDVQRLAKHFSVTLPAAEAVAEPVPEAAGV